jgi:hypothetical protein
MTDLDDDLAEINKAWYFCLHGVKLGHACAECSVRCWREKIDAAEAAARKIREDL